MSDAKVLYVDIENSPNVADVWGLWDQNVGLTQLRESSRIIGVGYRWGNQKRTTFLSIYDRNSGKLVDNKAMLKKVRDLYDEADIVVTYDWHGNYGHPDHIKVHQVGHRAAEISATPTVFEVTMNRDHIGRLMSMAAEFGAPGRDEAFDPEGPADDGNPFGMPEAEITHAVDVGAYLVQKRSSMRCHRSQITDTSFFLEMPDEAFAVGFGTEWYIKRKGDGALAHDAVGSGPRVGWLFE